MTHAARRFANQLGGRYQLPVYLCDERLSTIEALQLAGQKSARDNAVDAIAAHVILQTFFSHGDQTVELAAPVPGAAQAAECP